MTFERKIRYGVEYAAFRFVALGFAMFPVETASALSGWLWRHIAPHFQRHRRALTHLRMAMPRRVIRGYVRQSTSAQTRQA
ncbi:MAG: hypothetical protein JO273_10580 [Methylobacteriaceae bacterium]|nr:hypothetical protein [Methylobacteriaceae bacterium]